MSLWKKPLSALFNLAQPEQVIELNRKLHAAVEMSSPQFEEKLIEQLKPLLRQGADINATDSEGETILSKLCGRGFDKAVSFAIDKNAQLLDVNAYADSALGAAARGANLPAVKTVIAELQKANAPKAIYSEAAESLAETRMTDEIAGKRFRADAVDCMRELMKAGAEVSDEAQKYAARHVSYLSPQLPKVTSFIVDNLMESRDTKAENDRAAMARAQEKREMRKIVKEDAAVNVQLRALRQTESKKAPGAKA